MLKRKINHGYIKLFLALPLFLSACNNVKPTAEEDSEHLVPGIFLESELTRFALPQGVQARTIFDPGINVTKLSEGFIPKLYNDPAGFCTIAYGHLIKKQRCNGSEPLEFLDGVTEPEGTVVLHKDMHKAEVAVTALTRRDLKEGEYAALVDFTFNVGCGNFQRSSLLRVVNRGDFQKVPYEFRKWVIAGGKKYPGLQKRREREIALFFDGVARGGPQPQDSELIDIRTGENP